jgi:ankyrin repeat protein
MHEGEHDIAANKFIDAFCEDQQLVLMPAAPWVSVTPRQERRVNRMKKTILMKHLAVITTLIALLLGLTGCATAPSKKSAWKTEKGGGQSISFKPFLLSTKDLSSRTQQPRISSAQKEKLLKSGYAMIGWLKVENREKECWEGEECKSIYSGSEQPTTALLKAASRRGADLAVMEKDNLSYATAISKKGKCIQKVETCGDVWVPRMDSSGMMVKELMYVCSKECVEWEMFRGEAHIAGSSALLWRKHPELAQAQLTEGLSSTGWNLPAAAREGSLIKTKMLLSMDADPNQKDEDGETPLHLAARSGHTAVAELLLAKGVNVNTKDKDGETPLHGATLEMAKLLIAKGASVNAKREYGYTPLHTAAWEGNTAVVKLLIASGADINARAKKDWTPLMSAVQGNRIEVVKLLLKSGADPTLENRYDSENQSCCNALDIALYRKHTAVAQELEKWGAKGTKRRKAGIYKQAIAKADAEFNAAERARKKLQSPPEQLALINAAAEGRLSEVRRMLKKGIDVNRQVGQGKPTALYAACETGQLQVVRALLKRGADPNRKIIIGSGYSPLIVAAEKGHTEIVRALLDKGANINHATFVGGTALMVAAQNGHTKIVRALMDKGADPNQRNAFGEIALHGAAARGHVEVAELLIAKGVKVDARDEDDQDTPLHRAATANRTAVAELLIAKGADVNAKATDGDTPLHRAAEARQIAVVKLLIAKGANVNIKNKRGRTPLNLVKRLGYKDMISLLEQHGAK